MRLAWWTWLLIAVAAACVIMLAVSPFWPKEEPPTVPTPTPAPTSPTPTPEPPAAEPEETPPPEVELKNVPEGAVFDPETRTFSWQTQPGDAGIYIGVCFRVTDPGGLYDEECINIYVLKDNQAPHLLAVPLKHVQHGGVVTFTLQATDPDGDELEYFSRNIPQGAVFDPPTFTWLTEELGIWPGIIVGVTDGRVKVTQQVTIAVE